MKLKKLATTTDDRLEKLNKFIDSMDLDSQKYKDTILYSDKNGFVLHCFKPELSNQQLKETVKNLITKYWKNFEAGIDFHVYDGDYFIEIRQDSENRWHFYTESLDDEFYCKFDTDFIINL